MYDEIANLYHLIYEDWDAAIERQASALNRVFEQLMGPGPLSVLDVSCGIGTQALGLAACSHRVTASDLSPGSIGRARREAAIRSLPIEFTVADMRDCKNVHGSGFDVVLSADNSIPHLPEAEISEALASFYESLCQGGVAVIGMRDYAEHDASDSSMEMVPYGIRQDGNDRYFVFQIRDWQGAEYNVTMYFVREARNGKPANVTSGVSRYYALEVERVACLLREVGFVEVRRIDDAIYQPLVVGRRA